MSRSPLALLILFMAIGTAPAGAADRFLKADGTTLRDDRGRGEVVTLRGVNLGGWLLFEGWMCPMDSSGLKDDESVREALDRRFGPKVRDELIAAYQDAYITEADLDNIAALGMNVVRLPFWYRTVLRDDGTWRDDAFRRLDWLVDAAWKRGIYTILDFHGLPGGQSDSDTTGRVRKKSEGGPGAEFWTVAAHQQQAIAIWRRVAEHYKGNPAVAAYDLINEPIGAPSARALWSAYDRMYRAIRAVDPDHVITVEGCWSGKVDGRDVGWGWDALPDPSRPGWANVLYQTHNYEWDWNNLDKQLKSVDVQVRDFDRHKPWNVPGLIGEFNPMGQEKAWAAAIERYSAAGLGWTIWSYKASHGTGNDSWGVYNPRDPMPPRPDIRQDPVETIRAKWSAWGSAAFAINPMLRRTVAMPVPKDDAFAAEPGRPLAVAAPGVLGNDAHLNLGEPGVRPTARLLAAPAHGKLDLRPDGSFSYTPEAGFAGDDSFRYRSFDGRLDSAIGATVRVRVAAPAR